MLARKIQMFENTNASFAHSLMLHDRSRVAGTAEADIFFCYKNI